MYIDKMPGLYSVGTASVEAGGVTVTPAGALWFGNVWGDDLFFLPSQPLVPPQRVKEVNDDGTLTLAYPWPGVAAATEPYEIRYVGIIERSTAQTRRVLEQLGDVKAWYDIIVADDAARLALETETRPLPANYRVITEDTNLIWAKKSGAYGDWIGPVEFRGPKGDTPTVVATASTLPAGSSATAVATPVTGGVSIAFGVPAGRSNGYPYRWSTNTADADPGGGNIRANNTNLASATLLFVSKASAAGSAMAAYLLAMADSTNPIKGDLALQRVSDGATVSLRLTAVTDAGGYVKLAVTGQSGETALTNGGDISLNFQRAGNQGNLSGVTSFWTGRLAADVDAAAARLGLGALNSTAIVNENWDALPHDGVFTNLTNGTGTPIATDGLICIQLTRPDGSKSQIAFRLNPSFPQTWRRASNAAGVFGGWVELVGANNSVTNAILADVASGSIKGRIAVGAGDPEDLTAAQVWGILGVAPIANAYAKSTILGTVSQSSGVPTGALIEQGSNANGQYARFADGTQLCWNNNIAITATTATTALVSWVMPAAFSSANYTVSPPALTSVGSFTGSKRTGIPYRSTASASSCEIGFLSNALWTIGDSATASVVAIGRWF